MTNPETQALVSEALAQNYTREKIGRSPSFYRNLGLGLVLASQTVPRFLDGIIAKYPGDVLSSFKYMIANLPVNPIWGTITNETVTAALNGNKEAARDIIGQYSLSIAGGLGGALLVGGIVSYINSIKEKSKIAREAYFNGELAVTPKGPQIFAIGGSGSNILDYLSLSHPDKITSIFENSAAASLLTSAGIVRDNSLSKGVYVNLKIDSASRRKYSNADSSWRTIDLSEDNLIHTRNGKRILLVVGFGEQPEEELTSEESPFRDVTHEELHTSAQKLKERFEQCGINMKDVEIIKVYLGSGDLPVPTDDGVGTISDSNSALSGQDSYKIRIYIDTWKHLVKEILSKSGPKGIRLISKVPEYWNMFRKMMSKDRLFNSTNDPGDVPMAVYQKISDESVISALNKKSQFPNRSIFVLTSNIADDFLAISNGLETICSAVVLGDIVQRISKGLIEGKSPEDIQLQLDMG